MPLLLVAAMGAIATSPPVSAEPIYPKDMPVLGPAAPSVECPPISRFHANRQRGKLAPRKLNELPSADAYAAVLRHDGRCQVPVIIRYNVRGR